MSGRTTYPGIDYGLGSANRDPTTGIRYGVISMNALAHWAWDDMEESDEPPTCPECGGSVKDYEDLDEDADGSEQEYANYREHSCSDFVCVNCKHILGGDDVYSDDSPANILNRDGYEGFVDEQNDLMLTKSDYYTHAQFCSPCAPGAGHLENPCFEERQVRFPRSRKRRIRKKWAARRENYALVPLGPKTYCLSHDWFEDRVAPYPVFRADNGARVLPDG